MSLKLYTFPGDYRGWKILIAAEYSGLEVEVPKFELGKDNKSEAFKQRHHPLGKVPVLETPNGSLFESGAILRYVGRLRPEANLIGATFWQQARVEQWVEFCANELEPSAGIWLFPVLEHFAFDQSQYNHARGEVTQIFSVLNSHLTHHTYLVGNFITLADISFVCAIVPLWTQVLDGAFRTQFPAVTRWFETCVHQPQFAKVLGGVTGAENERRAKGHSGSYEAPKGGPAPSAGGDDAAPAPKKEGGKKEGGKKEGGKKEGGKKEGGKKEGGASEDGGKKEGGKKEGGKKEGGKKGGDGETGSKKEGGKKKSEEPKPKKDDKKGEAAKKSETELLEDAAAAEEQAVQKRKNPLELLPASPMHLDAVKKLFFLQRPYNPAFFGEFWKMFDNNGYSFWRIELKEDSTEEYWKASNLLGGYIQRAEECRKYAFGVLNMQGKRDKSRPEDDNEVGPFHINGAWLFRGTEIITEMKECPDSDTYTWTRIDVTSQAGRDLVQSLYVGNAEVPTGKEVLDRRYFK